MVWLWSSATDRAHKRKTCFNEWLLSYVSASWARATCSSASSTVRPEMGAERPPELVDCYCYYYSSTQESAVCAQAQYCTFKKWEGRRWMDENMCVWRTKGMRTSEKVKITVRYFPSKDRLAEGSNGALCTPVHLSAAFTNEVFLHDSCSVREHVLFIWPPHSFIQLFFTSFKFHGQLLLGKNKTNATLCRIG